MYRLHPHEGKETRTAMIELQKDSKQSCRWWGQVRIWVVCMAVGEYSYY